MRTLYKKKREFLVQCLRENSLKLLEKEIEIQGAVYLLLSLLKEYLLCLKNS